MREGASSPRAADAWRADLRRQQHLASANATSSLSGAAGTAPPLPPKPSFARGEPLPETPIAVNITAASVGSGPGIGVGAGVPPPLPPKPSFARAEPKPALPPRPHARRSSTDDPLHLLPAPPARPLPPLPITDIANGGESDAAPLPPERSVLSSAAPSLFFGTDAPDRSDDGEVDEEDEDGLGARGELPSQVDVPVPPPRCALACAGFHVMFGEDRLRLPHGGLADVATGAMEIARTRARGRRYVSGADVPGAEIRAHVLECAPFEGKHVGREVFEDVLEACAEREVGSELWKEAVVVMVGMLISTVLKDMDGGYQRLLQVCLRLLEAKDVRRKEAVFTVLLNFAAQGSCFVPASESRRFEKMAARALCEVVMKLEKADERNEGVWDKAMRCALLLMHAADDLVQSAIEKKALVLLARRAPSMVHSDAKQLLLERAMGRTGMAVGAVNTEKDEDPNRTDSRVEGGTVFEELDDVLSLYVNSVSLTSRRTLFLFIFEAAVRSVRSKASFETLSKEDFCKQTLWLRAVLEAHDAADAFVLPVCQGTENSFVMDVVHSIFFAPLLKTRGEIDMLQQQLDNSDSSLWMWPREDPNANNGNQNDEENGLTEPSYYTLADRRHARAMRAAGHLLHKPFVLRVLRELQTLANDFARKRAEKEAKRDRHFWRHLSTVEKALLAIRSAARTQTRVHSHSSFSESANSSRASMRQIDSALADIHAVVLELQGISSRDPLRAAQIAARLAEVFLSVLFYLPAHTTPTSATHDTTANASAPSGSAAAAAACVSANVVAAAATSSAVQDSHVAQFLGGLRCAARALLARADCRMFSALAEIMEPLALMRRVSELRQALVEIVGSYINGAHDAQTQTRVESCMRLLLGFVEDRDPAVAYRASALHGLGYDEMSSIASGSAALHVAQQRERSAAGGTESRSGRFSRHLFGRRKAAPEDDRKRERLPAFDEDGGAVRPPPLPPPLPPQFARSTLLKRVADKEMAA